MSGRASLGGVSTDAAATHSNYALRGSLPPMPTGSVLEPFDIYEPPANKFSLFEALAISFLTGVGFVVAAFLLLVDT